MLQPFVAFTSTVVIPLHINIQIVRNVIARVLFTQCVYKLITLIALCSSHPCHFRHSQAHSVLSLYHGITPHLPLLSECCGFPFALLHIIQYTRSERACKRRRLHCSETIYSIFGNTSGAHYTIHPPKRGYRPCSHTSLVAIASHITALAYSMYQLRQTQCF